MKIENLTNVGIGQLEIRSREYDVTDSKVRKLKIRVLPSGSRIFYVYWKRGGRLRKLRIGKFGEIGLPAARKAAEKYLAEIALGRDPLEERVEERKRELEDKMKGMTLGEFLDERYYPWAGKVQKSFVRTRQIFRTNFMGWMDKGLLEIGVKDMDEWSRGRLEGGVGAATINRASVAVKAALNKAVEWGVIEKNGLSGWKRLKVKEGGVVRWLSDDEEGRLMDALDALGDVELGVFIRVLLWTGMRPKEALMMEWDMVKLEERRLVVAGAYSKTGQTRVLPIGDKLMEVLTEWKRVSDVADGGGGWLFPRVRSGSGERARFQFKQWKRLMKASGIENFRVYDLRHTFASRLVMNGVDLYTVSQLLGHSDVKMTKVYAHLSDGWMLDAVNKI